MAKLERDRKDERDEKDIEDGLNTEQKGREHHTHTNTVPVPVTAITEWTV